MNNKYRCDYKHAGGIVGKWQDSLGRSAIAQDGLEQYRFAK